MYSRLRRSISAVFTGHHLKAKVFRGGAWLATGNVTEQGFRFARNLILVRLLAPSAFGTMAVVLSASSLLQTCTDIGVREALIQNPKGDKPEYVGAAWWMAFSRAVAIYCFIFLIAPLVGSFYRNPELSPLLRVAVAAGLFEGAISSRAYVALKELKFKKWVIINHAGAICGIAATIILTFFLRNVWALVLGACAEGAARCILSFVVCPFLPPTKWDRDAFRDLLKFSRGQFGLSFMALVYLRTDIFVLAKLFSSAQVGVYTMGIYLAQVPTSFALMLLGNLMVPAFSKIQGDNARTNQIVLKVGEIVLLLGMPAIAFAFFAGRPLLSVIYGDRYALAAGPLFVAAIVAVITLVNSQATGVFYANGRPQLHRWCVAATSIVMIVITYPLARFLGPIGGQIACLVAMSVGCGLQLSRLHHMTGFDLKGYLRPLTQSAGAAAIVVGVSLLGRVLHFSEVPLATVMVGVLGLFLAYTAIGIALLRQMGAAPTFESGGVSEREIISQSVSQTVPIIKELANETNP